MNVAGKVTPEEFNRMVEEERDELASGLASGVLEEIWHIERRGRLGDLSGLTERAHRIFTPLLPVTDEAFAHALTIDLPQLGSNDRVHAGTCFANGIETIVSADRGFDRARGLRRIDPLNTRAVRRLLAAP